MSEEKTPSPSQVLIIRFPRAYQVFSDALPSRSQSTIVFRPDPFEKPVVSVTLPLAMAGTQGPTVVAVAITFAVISFVTIFLRLWARVFVAKTVGADDGLYSKQPFILAEALTVP